MTASLPPNEKRRLEELRRYALLDTPPEKAFDDITALAARIFKVPISTVTLIDEDRQWFKSCVGLETREVGREFAFCAFAILGDEVMIVPDARTDARFTANPLVLGPPRIRFYAGAPLKTRNGLNLGTLSIIDTKPRQLSPEMTEMLAGLAALVVSEMELRYQIGERRRTAERLRLLELAMRQNSESMMIITAGLDPPGPEIVFVNPAFSRLTGYRAEEVIGKTACLLFGPATDHHVLDGAREQLAQGVEFTFEAIHHRQDGGACLLSTHVSPLRGEDGRLTHFICLQTDADERDKTGLLLRRAKEEAERANREKSAFLSRMSHELRTPMHAILGFAELLEMDCPGSESAESVAQIVHAGKHLLGLINEVLDIAAVESGKLVLTLEPVSVRDTLEQTLSLMRPLAAKHQVRLGPLTGDLDHEVLADPQRLKQVILNLLSNAVKFNRDGGAVTVSGEKIGGHLRIRVVDAGDGIKAHRLTRMFVPFERLGSENTAIEGAGLGLSLSKHLVEAMHGRIGVQSTPGEGSTFWVELPVIEEAPRPLNAGNSGATKPGASTAPRIAVPSTLLYVEDNLSNLRLVERILARRPEVKLISALQGRTGLELARKHRPDLLLIDVHLPDLSGDEILRQLRADPWTSQIPVVMISADATAARIERLLAAGANDYITKPVDVRRFLALIDAIKPRDAAPPPGLPQVP